MKNIILGPLSILMFIFISDYLPAQNEFMTGENISQSLYREVLRTYQINYLIYLPEDYEKSSKAWPLVLFLHGSGERGTDLELVKRNGLPKLIEEGQEFPFIIVSPQCADLTIWDNQLLVLLLVYIESKYNVDKNSEYLTGLSMGGHAIWSLAIQNPGRHSSLCTRIFTGCLCFKRCTGLGFSR
jgi:predicted peptidase